MSVFPHSLTPGMNSAASRRVFLQAGGFGLLGAHSLTGVAQAKPAPQLNDQGFGRAKRLIFIFMWGGPSHLDTFDMKPKAPVEIRGSFEPIATSAPGIQICEHFHRLAPLMDRIAIVRSLNHNDPAHLSSAHTLLTGHLPPVNKTDAIPPSPRDTPHIGSVISRVMPNPPGLPPFVTVPWIVSHPAAPGGKAPGQNGGWLGRTYDPFLAEGNLANRAGQSRRSLWRTASR